MTEEIINKVAQSALFTINLEEYFPAEKVLIFDLKPYLFMELILKEKDFRTALQDTDWSIYEDAVVGVTCSADAIIPIWAYMLVTTYLEPVAKNIMVGDKQEVEEELLLRNIRAIDLATFAGKRIVVKGCGDIQINASAYLEITKLLKPVAKSIMYGEPCSTVPVYKAK